VTLGGGTGWRLEFDYTFAHNAKASAVDYLRVSIGSDVLFEQLGKSANRNAKWTHVSIDLDDYAGQTVRITVEAADNGADSLVEAALDDIRIYRQP
jgi:hypothetical protein